MCLLELCWIFIQNRIKFPPKITKMEVSSSSKREKEMLLLFYRGYAPSVGSSVVNHSKMYFLQSECECVFVLERVWLCLSVHVPVCVWWRDDYPPGTFSLNALFFNIVLENYRRKWLIKKSTYFLLRWRVTWPDLCFCEFVQLIESCQCGIRVLCFVFFLPFRLFRSRNVYCSSEIHYEV